MSVDLSALPGTVTVAAGSRAEIPLPSYAGSGNRWSARCVDGSEVARVAVETGRIAQRAAAGAEPPPLALAPETAVVLGIAPGRAVWELVLARPFDRTATAVHGIEVVVVGEEMGAG